MDINNRKQIYKKLEENGFSIEYEKPLAPFTSWRIGGPAEAFVVVTSKEDYINLFKLINEVKLPFFILGGGSNILISDKGVNKLVIKNNYQNIEFLDEVKGANQEKTADVVKKETHWREGLLTFSDIDYEESTDIKTRVRVSSGVVLQQLINKTLEKGLTGLQWFSGIPGTVGGAVYNNIHGGTKHFGDYIESVELLVDGEVKNMTPKDLEMGYDYSLLHKKNYPVISVALLLNNGDIEKAKLAAVEWTKRKTVQPRNSCGSVFKNLDSKIAQEAGLENPSAGYVIDNLLNMRGYISGGVQVYDKHANFIINKGEGKASDVYSLVQLIKKRAKEELGVELEEEFFYVGDFV